MAARRVSHKINAAASSGSFVHPFDYDRVLDLILSFVGHGDWLYVAPVSRRVRDMYRHIKQQRKRGQPRHDIAVTFYKQAATSPSRLQHAVERGSPAAGTAAQP